MKSFILICLIGLQIFVLAIDQKCTTNQLCPQQAYCSNSFCICNSGYIGNCNIPALTLTSSQTAVSLNSSQTTYFSVTPEETNHYIQFTFSVCLNLSLSLTFTLWIDTGSSTNFTSSNAISQPNQYIMTNGCNQLRTNSLTFGKQPNGQNDLLVLGIIDNGIASNIQISVSQKKVMAVNLYQYILIVLVIFVGLSIIIAAVTFLIRRRRRNGTHTSSPQNTARNKPTYNNIEHFDSFMPLFPADKLSGQLSNCPICLEQIQKAEVVRRTPCKHIFHSSCLDSWCLKSISCPVCRRDFSLSSLNEPRRSRNVQIIQDPNYKIRWQQQQQEQPNSDRQPLQQQNTNELGMNRL